MIFGLEVWGLIFGLEVEIGLVVAGLVDSELVWESQPVSTLLFF